MTGDAHPLTAIFADLGRGLRPPADGVVEVFGAPPGPADAVVGFTAHHCVAADVEPEAVLRRLPADDLSAPLRARFLAWLGDELETEPGALDVLLLATDLPEDVEAEPLERRNDLDTHPRVARALRYRDDLRVFSDSSGTGIVTLGRGLARRWEVSVEVDPESRDAGLARRLARAARALVPPDAPLWAQVAPGNAASVRAFLAAGYRPIGAEVLFLRR